MDLAFTQHPSQLPEALSQGLEPLLVSPNLEAGQPRLRIWRLPDGVLIHRPQVGAYAVTCDQITSYSLGQPEQQVRANFLSRMTAAWLETNGFAALHASAVAANGKAILFLANSLAGKSTLAAGCLAAGAELLTDDIAALDLASNDYRILPAFPRLRLWPASRQGLEIDLQHTEKLDETSKRQVRIGAGGWGRFAGAPAPLGAIYLPQRGPAGSPVQIEPLPGREAVIELMRNLFFGPLVYATRRSPARLADFQRLVARLPLLRLRYPADYAVLPRVVETVLNNLHQ